MTHVPVAKVPHPSHSSADVGGPVGSAPFEESRRAAANLPARLLSDSTDLGWDHVLVRTFADDLRAEEFETLPTPDLLLVLVDQGAGVIESRRAGRWTQAQYHPGAVGITTPGNSSTLRWRTTSTTAMSSVHVHLPHRMLEDTYEAAGVRPELPDTLTLHDPFVRESLRQLARASQRGAAPLYAEVMAQALASHVIEVAQQVRPGPAPARGLSPAALRDVTAYMNDHFGDRLSLDDLAAVTHHSKYHFLRLFRASTGTTPHRYLSAIRMSRAADLLKAGEPPLAVAHAVGYRSASQFAETFRRATGATPGAFQAAEATPHRRIPTRAGNKPVVGVSDPPRG